MNGLLEKKPKVEKSQQAEGRTARNAADDKHQHEERNGPRKQYPPMSNILVEDEAPPEAASEKRAERRKQKRAGVKILARVRPVDNNDPKFEEVLSTVNASRANLYFITTSRNYYKMMRLRVTFPYDAKFDKASIQEDIAEVVRLDHLPGGKTGVAVELQRPVLSPSSTNTSGSLSVGKPNKEQRFAIRHAISAAANMIDAESKSRLRARCSDLSMAGCYIDTMNPLPKGSRVLLQLTYKEVNFVAFANAISNHVGMGMGLSFEKLDSEQESILTSWLFNRTSKTAPAKEELTVPKVVEPAASNDLSDRALMRKLLALLESNAKLVPF